MNTERYSKRLTKWFLRSYNIHNFWVLCHNRVCGIRGPNTSEKIVRYLKISKHSHLSKNK